jgi:hypothetical protein
MHLVRPFAGAMLEKSYEFYSQLHDRFERGTPIWITEAADAAWGGNPWAAEFLDTFPYLDRRGRLVSMQPATGRRCSLQTAMPRT